MGLQLRHGLVAVLFATVSACGSGGSGGGQDDAAPAQSDAAVVDTTPADRAPVIQQDTGGGVDVAVPVDTASTDTATGPWPPAGPWHTGKVCTLPACNAAAAETTDLSGNWLATMTTESQNCNALVATMDPRMQVGHVETTTETFPRAGECIYNDVVGGTIVGVIKGNVMIYCEVLPAQSGVTPILELQQTFTGNTSGGQGWTYLFDMPLPPSECQAIYTVTQQRQ